MTRHSSHPGGYGGGGRSGGELHRAWLELTDIDGPFLAIPALRRVWPQGMPPPRPETINAIRDAKPAFEHAWERWDADSGDATALAAYRDARDSWVQVVLQGALGWDAAYQTPATIPEVRSPDYTVTVCASGALTHEALTGALVLVVDPADSLRDPLEDGWSASPVDRMEELLRAAGVPIGVVTDGRWWGIVSARPKAMAASGIVDSQTWTEEPLARNAFIELLQLRRLVGGKPEDRLTELFGESVAAAEDITEALGTQVRRAVELLVQAMSEAALEATRRGEPDPLPANRAAVYEAAVTVMMRVVFLLFAEERGLLPQGRLFTAGYGISEELDVLDDRAREEGSESLDGTHLTWHRVLATSRALYQGASFEDIRLPSYGGSLFDPARFGFLTTRSERGTLAVAVSDRVMLEVLRAVQVAELRGQPARRISFRDIDVEQIGYIYEGLLGYSSAPVLRVMVGLIGKAGEEPEIPLATLEDLTASHPADAALADAILAWVKEHQSAATPPTKAALAKAIRAAADVEDAERALRAIAPADEALRDRLRPFIGVIRRDLRNRPLVVAPGGVLVVETPSRSSAGAHYTPRSLAQEVVQHALDPLVYAPGPHQIAERDRWVPVSSDQILELRVADIACGSGAFLVAAARFLAARLVEAWQRQGDAVGTAHDLQVHAIRTVVAKCLYGADINEMAVEMCKLSLWLVSLDPKLPFSFVDDKVLHGNALLGLTSARQLSRQHIDPDSTPAQSSLYELDVDGVLGMAARLRGQLANEVDDSDPQRSATAKRRQWHDYQQLTAQLTDVADAVIAAGLRLGGKPGRALQAAYQDLALAIEGAYPGDFGTPERTMLDAIKDAGLTPTVTTDYKRWKPLHWIIAIPDVMGRGGFDAIIGNPPFLGGKKISGALGSNMREWLVNLVGDGKLGNADLVAYFFLRSMSLLNRNGNLGLIATNTVAQGDTREVGLDQIVAQAFTITRAIQSQQWPVSSVSLEFAAIWGTRATVVEGVPKISNDVAVRRISTLLEPTGRVDGRPIRLAENAGIIFQGCVVLGMGFVLESAKALGWIASDSRNAEVLFPFLNGEDLNSQPDTSPSRWVIDFAERSLAESGKYTIPFQHVEQIVQPERSKSHRNVYRERWWQFAEKQLAMRRAIAGLNEILVIALMSNTVMPVRVPTGQVFSQTLGVVAYNSYSDQAVLSAGPHQLWAIKYGSTLQSGLRYTPSDVFRTLPRPARTERLGDIGKALDTERREMMWRRQLGLTKLYNLVNDPDTPDSADQDVARLREIHAELDHAVMAAYGWDDVPLEHGFHTYRQMERWTVSPAARVEILDRLLAENHRRAELQGDAPPLENPEEGDEV